jgi:predicted RNase H-like nuclease (RuvC/YqgF family)
MPLESAIQEEIQRANKSSDAPASETFGTTVEHVKHSPTKTTTRSADERKVQELEHEIMDLKITNRGKDFLIKQLQSERDGIIDKMLTSSRTVGQLETKLNQLGAAN